MRRRIDKQPFPRRAVFRQNAIERGADVFRTHGAEAK